MKNKRAVLLTIFMCLVLGISAAIVHTCKELDHFVIAI